MNALGHSGAPQRHARTRILVVEDDVIVARDIQTTLQGMDYQVVDVIRRGEWVRTALEEHDPALVLMDIRLAGDVDGVDAAELARREFDVPVVFLTAYADEETLTRASRTRPFGYVVKPFTGRDLKTAVEVALVRHRMEQELEAEGARLAERVKEQSCLYEVLRILHAADRPLPERLQAVVERLPEGWQYPDVTEARLEVDGESHRTGGYRDTPWRMEEPITLDGEPVGRITVCYLEERSVGGAGPFLEEEERLLAAVADRVAHELERDRIRRRAERLADIVETTSDFVGMANAGGRAIWVNRPGRQMLGIPADQPLDGTPITEFSPPWAARVITEEGLPAAREEGVWQGETAFRGADGTEIPVSQVIIAHRDDAGEVSYFSTIARDISERKEMESRVRESERRFREMAEAIGEVFWLRDPATMEMHYVSPAFEEIWGMDAADLDDEPRGWLEAIHPDDRPQVIQAVLEDQDPAFDLEYRIIRPDGDVRWIQDRAFPVTDDSGALYRVAGVARDITDRKRFESELEHRALHDYLTELPNRALFRDRLTHAMERAERTGEHIAVLFLDLRRFKLVNDSLGHDAGDRVLVEVARRLKEAVRDQDTLARMGGDEFTVLLEDLDDAEADACEVAERLAGCFGPSIALESSEAIQVDASIGICVYDPEEHAEASGSDLIRAADAAMYRSKTLSGTRYSIAEPSEEPARTERFEREQRLRKAVEQDTLDTAYQPIYSLTGGEMVAVEALARWEDPELGTISPGEFIPLAEEAGFIVALGEQQLERACRQVRALQIPERSSPPHLHVNLSLHQIESPEVVGRFRQVLERTGFPPSRLCLEITESAAMRRPQTIRELADEGVMLAVDDFGTRHSTLSRLRDLPVDMLKIDRSFVSGLPDDAKDRALVETILTLGRTLGLQVVAEGVENEAQLELLRSLGCHQAQGFHLARPGTLEDLREELAGTGEGD